VSRDPEGAPGATYRVQLRAGFGFDELAEIVPYLRDLGITHVHCSPYLRARPNSPHGYDVVDHTVADPELGGTEGLARMCAALEEASMSHILDIVPNHMAIGGRASKWWWEVLRDGPQSAYARFFDIDWDPPDRRLRDKILVPILADHYGRVLEAGELMLQRDGDDVFVRYYDNEVPVAPGSIESLPGAPADPDEAIELINSEPALLHALLDRQHYRLALWHTDLELNYRRFFDINELVALRMEEPGVFELVHSLPLSLIDEGHLTGMRIDHVDGLRAPQGYLDRLREAAGRDAYIVVEKILERAEELPETWPVEGTTGYDFLAATGGLLIDPSGEKALTDLYVTFTGEDSELEDLVHEEKLKIMAEVLPSDLERLVSLLIDICERHPRHRDYTRNELRDALREVVAALDVYRTYIEAETRTVRAIDARRVEDAVRAAHERRPDLDPDLFGFLTDLLLLRYEGLAESDFVMRFQQTTGPVVAKAVEDTAFYDYNRFVALNEVGGSPGVWGMPVADFHAAMQRAAASRPHSMLATSTHDTKRSEDVRARLALLTEIPDRWAEAVRIWSSINERHRVGPGPDRNAEYLLYQTLVGAHPLDVERAVAYMQKASKEAKRYTSWTAPDEVYDAALESFVRGALDDVAFTSGLAGFVEPLVDPGRVNSLAQTLLKLTCPGVSDVYQGCELWDLSLVDPDNRRPVDYRARRALLDACDSAETAMERWDEGGSKQFLIRRALAARRAAPRAFGGIYEPILLEGHGADRAVSFARNGIIAVAPRLPLTRPRGWEETEVVIPQRRWNDVLTGEPVPVRPRLGALWARFPVALLIEGEA
jgi:(1->4)-alpha-D-glucan 1-alpha-D-glucosylmutase